MSTHPHVISHTVGYHFPNHRPGKNAPTAISSENDIPGVVNKIEPSLSHLTSSKTIVPKYLSIFSRQKRSASNPRTRGLLPGRQPPSFDDKDLFLPCRFKFTCYLYIYLFVSPLHTRPASPSTEGHEALQSVMRHGAERSRAEQREPDWKIYRETGLGGRQAEQKIEATNAQISNLGLRTGNCASAIGFIGLVPTAIPSNLHLANPNGPGMNFNGVRTGQLIVERVQAFGLDEKK